VFVALHLLLRKESACANYSVFCGQSDVTTILRIISKPAQFSEENFIENKMCLDFAYTLLSGTFVILTGIQ
jgi:hypothetical protein